MIRDKKFNLVHICTLCNLAINTPCRTSKCDHAFCCDCITMWLKDNNSCPFRCTAIRHEDFFFISKKDLNQTSAPFKCPLYQQGCKKVLCKSELQYHAQNECEYRAIGNEQLFIQKDQYGDKNNKYSIKQFNSNCFLDLSPLSNLSNRFNTNFNTTPYQQDGIKSPINFDQVFVKNNTQGNLNIQSNQTNEENHYSSVCSNIGTQNIPDESETAFEFFPSIQNLTIEQVQMAEISKAIVFMNDQFRRFISHFIFTLKSKSAQSSPFESILEKNDLYFQQLEQKVEQLKRQYVKSEQVEQNHKGIVQPNCSEMQEVNDLIKNQPIPQQQQQKHIKVNEMRVLQEKNEKPKLFKNLLQNENQVNQKSVCPNPKRQQISNNNAQSYENKNIFINIDNDDIQNGKVAKKVNISLLSNQENNSNILNLANEKQRITNTIKQNKERQQQNSQTSIKVNNLFPNEQIHYNQKIPPNQGGLQQKKNSSYSDLKKVQKVTFEKNAQNTTCNLTSRNSLKSWRKTSSRENLRLNTQEQLQENALVNSPCVEFNKTSKTQQTSRNSIVNILQFPLQFYNDQNDQQDQQPKINIVSQQSIQEQFTSRFDNHGISAQSGEDCKNLDTEEFSTMKIQTKNFSINRNQLDAKENDNFEYSHEDQLLNNNHLLGNQTFQPYQKSNQTSQSFMENGEENINDVTQVDMQNTNTTVHFLKACKSTLNNSVDLKQSYQNYLNPKYEKQIIQQLEQDPKNQGKCLKENDIRYIVNAKWWRNWTQYVSFYEKDNNTDNYDHSNLLGINYYQSYTSHMKNFGNQYFLKNPYEKSDKRFSVNYERPGYINNRVLTKDSYLFENYPNVNTNLLQLNENLLEHHDYVVLSKAVFMQLKKWYNIDVIIPRFIKFDSFERMFYVELYPEKNYHPKSNSSRSNSNNEGKNRKITDSSRIQLSHSRNNTISQGNGVSDHKYQMTMNNSKEEIESFQSNPVRYASVGSLKWKGLVQHNQMESEKNFQGELLNEDNNKQCSIF